MKRLILCVYLVFWAYSVSLAQGTDPLNLPLLQSAEVTAAISKATTFTVPWSDGKGSYMNWSPHGVLGPGANGSLYFACHDWYSTVARIQPPTTGTTATVLEPCGAITNLWSLNPGDPNSTKIGGAIWTGTRLLVSAYSYYDGNGTAVGSHFVGQNTASLTGMAVTINTGKAGWKPAFTGQAMGKIPPEWRTLLKGDTLSVGCCKAVIARDSYGFSLTSFWGDAAVTNNTLPGTALIGYPEANQNLGAWNSDGSGGYNMNYVEGFAAIVNNTRTVLYVAGKGTGFCYGTGTADASLVGTKDQFGNDYCYDPDDLGKGGHGYPLISEWAAYDLRDVVLVAAGSKQPWDVKPYASGSFGRGRIVGGSYDHATGTLFYNYAGGEQARTVFKTVLNGGSAPPPPPDCIGTWTTLSTAVPAVCDATKKQTITDTFLFSENLPKVAGCVMPAPRPPVTRIVDCVYDPPPPPPIEICGDWLDNDGDGLIDEDCTIDVTYTCTVAGTPSTYADKDAKLTVRCDTNGAYLFKRNQTFTVTVTVPKP